MKKERVKKTENENGTKKCTKCGRELELSSFRVHGTSHFRLNQCRDCERSAATERLKNAKKQSAAVSQPSTPFTFKSKKGDFEVSLEPVQGFRKTSKDEQVLYIKAERDMARSIFAQYFGISGPLTGILTELVK